MKQCTVPTVGELLAAYPEIAAMERLRNERPTKRTVQNVLTGVKRVGDILVRLENGGDVSWENRPVTWFKRQRLEKIILQAGDLGLQPVTVWSYLSSLKGLTAKWCIPHYHDRGWKVGALDLPPYRRRAPRYTRPEREILLKVKDWYESLWFHPDKRYWLAATMMLEFAMRNGDVGRLRWNDFRPRDSKNGQTETILCYTPRKTEFSSGRVVAWPVHPELWEKMERVRESNGRREGTHFQGLVVPAAHQIFPRLNADLRSRHLFTGGKAAYELRKICIDHIYQKFGAEMASSISGDDIRTVTHYYADPSAVNAGAVRVVEML